MKRKSFAAVPITQNKLRFYFSTIPTSVLFPCCFVSRRDEEPETGFQRTLNERRAQDISNYLQHGTGAIPTNIVLSAQEIADVRYSSKLKTISFKPMEKGFLVLDGQHRLWGYHFCNTSYRKDLRIPVAIFSGLSRADEARIFIDINTTQRGVPAALLLDIKQVAEIENQKEEILRGLFDKLMDNSKSPMAGRMSPSKSAAGKISRVTFNRALDSVVTSPTFADLDKPAQEKLIINYLRAFESELVGDNRGLLFRAAFFDAIFDVFEEIIRISMGQHGNLKEASLREVIRPIAQLNFSDTRLLKGALAELMKSTLRGRIKVTSELL